MKVCFAKNLLYLYLFVCITLLGGIMLFSNIDVINKESIVIITFLINGIIIIFQLCKSSNNGYSLKDVVFLFMFIFMFVSPLIQYIKNAFPWWNTYLLTEEKIIYTNLIILLFILVYIGIYNRIFNNILKRHKFKNEEIKNISFVMRIFFIATVFCSLYIILKTGLSNLFARATNVLQIDSSSFGLIVSKTFRAVPIVYIAMNLLFVIKNKYVYRKIQFILCTILGIIVNFPTATARFWMAGIYLGILIIIKRKIKNPYLFKIMIFIGILVIFPAINAFRNSNFQEVISNGISIPKAADSFVSGDFDSYSMLVRSILYIDSYGVTLGVQLLGNLVFFVPRKIWPTKPIGTGAMIGESLGWEFTNVSCPYIGEGYINFGILGVLLFAIILALITKYGDKCYENVIRIDNSKVTFIEVVYPFSVGFLFFILRGDLLSSLSYYIGFMIPIIVLWVLQRLVNGKKIIRYNYKNYITDLEKDRYYVRR